MTKPIQTVKWNNGVMVKVRLKWKVGEPPIGRYRSFDKRGWPTAYYADDRPAAHIDCDDAYAPSRVRAGAHGELSVRIAQYHHTEAERKAKGAFTWRTLKKKVKTLAEAKDLAARAIAARPDIRPKDLESVKVFK